MRPHMLEPADHCGMVLGVYVRSRAAVAAAQPELNSRRVVDRRHHGGWVLHIDMDCVCDRRQARGRVLQSSEGHQPA